MSEKATSDQDTPVEDVEPEADEGGADPRDEADPGDEADTGGEAGSGDEAEPDGGDPGAGPVETEASTASPSALSEKLDHLQEEFDTLNDRHLRLAAEFNNYRRRQEAQMTEAWGRAQADLVGRFLDVLDDLQRVSALDPADEAVTVESIVEGIDLVERKFVRMLQESGAEVIAPDEGERFDPERMEAMMRVPDETGEREDEVAGLFQKGYVFRGTLVRPARVSVYKG